MTEAPFRILRSCNLRIGRPAKSYRPGNEQELYEVVKDDLYALQKVLRSVCTECLDETLLVGEDEFQAMKEAAEAPPKKKRKKPAEGGVE